MGPDLIERVALGSARQSGADIGRQGASCGLVKLAVPPQGAIGHLIAIVAGCVLAPKDVNVEYGTDYGCVSHYLDRLGGQPLEPPSEDLAHPLGDTNTAEIVGPDEHPPLHSDASGFN